MIEAGDPRAPALLLLHGFPLDPSEWSDLIPLFAERFRVIAPDLFAPEWDVPGEPPDQMTVSRQAALRGLLAEMGVERFAVAGRGFGGAVALGLAAVGGGAEAAVLIDCVVPGTGLSAACADLRAGVDALDPALPLTGSTFQEALLLGSGQEVHATPPERFLSAGGTGRFLLELDAMDVAGSLDDLRVEVPILLLWGEQDRYVPSSLGERLGEALPSSTLGLLPGCGHFLIHEAGSTIGPMIHEYLRAAYLHAPHGHEEPGPVMLQLGLAPAWSNPGADLVEDEEDDWFDVDDEED